MTSPPAVVGDVMVVGSAVADGTDKPHPSGEVRAFDARDREAAVALGSGAAGAGRRRRGHVEGRELAARRRGQRLVGDRRRCRARARLRAHEQPQPRLLRRRAPRRQPVLRTPSWRSTPRPARASGTSRPCTTICGTTTSPRRPSCSTGARTGARCRPSRSRRRTATCSCSIAATDDRSCRTRAAGAAERRRRRGHVADAAVSRGAGVAGENDACGGRRMGGDRRGPRVVPAARSRRFDPTVCSRRLHCRVRSWCRGTSAAWRGAAWRTIAPTTCW